MIFVTVGTHEQQFNRLVKDVDNLKKQRIISVDEQVLIQIGFSTYKPKYCKWVKFLSYEDMQRYFQKARIIITHGGPSSFLAPLRLGKIPIVMPRCAEYGEHVNNHQLDFVDDIAERFNNIIVVHNQVELSDAIKNYNRIERKIGNEGLKSNNRLFCCRLEYIANQLIEGKNL